MAFETLLVEQDAGIVTIKINRPPVNALSKAVHDDLSALLDQIRVDSSVRVVILTGGGDRAFVAGADIREINELDGVQAEAWVQDWHHLFIGLERMAQPVIAAINGVALGGGCELAMACDIRIAAEHASFGQPEINLGIIPGFGGTQRLPRIIGRGRALEMLMTGDAIDAAEALRIGLVNQVVSSEELMDTARNKASQIASKGAVALKLIKECVNDGLDQSLEEGLALEAGRFGAACATQDKVEGITAFLEKRKPTFTGS